MDFNLDKRTAMLKSSAGKYLKDKCPPAAVKEIIESEEGYSTAIWKEIVELGWTGLVFPEALGGFDMSFFELFALMEELGKVNFPGPFFTSAVISGLLIDSAGTPAQKDQYLPMLIDGEKIFTTAFLDEKGYLEVDRPSVEAIPASNDEMEINGSRFLVPFAHIADFLLVVAHIASPEREGPAIILVPSDTDGLDYTDVNTITGEKLFRVDFNEVKVPAENLIGNIEQTRACLHETISKVTVLKCGEMLGGLDTVLKLTVEHVKTRHQFGKPLGTLQAVQHHCADLATLAESTRLIASQAAYLISEGIPCEKEVATAKAWSGEAYTQGTRIAHQLHGAVGFTDEYHLHLFYKHAKASELSFGDAFYQRSKVADLLGI